MRLTGDEVLTQVQIYLNGMITAAHLAEIWTSDEKMSAYMVSRRAAADDLLDLIKDLREGKTIQDHIRANLDFLFRRVSDD